MRMKKFFIYLSIVALSMACDTNDDGFYNETYVEIPNLIQIQTQPSYTVGDFIFVTASVDRLLNESGETTLLDVRKTTNNADRFDFSYVLEKKVGDIWQVVTFSDQSIVIEKGALINAMPILYASAIYNQAVEKYESNVGLPLQSAGEYRISFDTTPKFPTKVELRSNSTATSLTLTIGSTVSQLGNDGYFNFTVLP